MGEQGPLARFCLRAMGRTRAGACVLLADADEEGRLEPLGSAGEAGLVEEYLTSVGIAIAHLPIPRIGARAAELWRQNPATQRVVPLTERGELLGIIVLLYDAPVRMSEGIFDLADLVEAAIWAIRAERAERRVERYNRLLQGTEAGVAIVDEAGEVRLASAAFARLVGRRSVVGKSLRELLGTGIGLDPGPTDVELRNGRRSVLCSIRVVPDHPRGWIVTLTEVGPMRALLAELEQRGAELAVANERLRQARTVERALLSAVAHELRNPLAILGHAYELLRGRIPTEGTPELADELETIGEAAATLERRIDDLVTFARLEVGVLALEPSALDLVDALRRARRCLCDPRAELVIACERDVPVLVGDPERIRQAFENLLLNARSHARERILISVEPKDASVVVQVANDGDTIPLADRERVLQPFVRLSTGRPGMGLGLAIARGIVEAHGGTLRIVDHPLGVAVAVELPLVGSAVRRGREGVA